MIGRTRSTAPSACGGANAPDDAVRYTWTCPICGASRTSFTSREPTAHQAVNALRGHVSTSEGDGHGRRSDYPDGYDSDRLLQHVSFDEKLPG